MEIKKLPHEKLTLHGSMISPISSYRSSETACFLGCKELPCLRSAAEWEAPLESDAVGESEGLISV